MGPAMKPEQAEAPPKDLRILDSSDATGIAACFPVMRELRDGLDLKTYEERVAQAMTQGYRLARAEAQGQVAGVIGYRRWNDLVFGHSLFVDDLVVAEARRGGGIGRALLCHAEAVARRESCAALRLNSGLWREGAHRFYDGHGFNKRGYAFVKPLT